jgi:hypothetical protein
MIASTGLLASRKESLVYPTIAMRSGLKFGGCPNVTVQVRLDHGSNQARRPVSDNQLLRTVHRSAPSRMKLPT